MSNREVQVWFQNRRAKVNRQRIPANSQVLQEPPLAPSPPQPHTHSPPSHRRMRSSPTHLLLPGVSSILNSDSCRGTYSAPPLFHATLPGIDSLQDGPSYQATCERYGSGQVPPSPQEPRSSDSFFNSSFQVRPSPPGSSRRTPICTPVPLHWRKPPRCRSPVPSREDHPTSPRRSSSDLPAGVTPDSLTPCSSTHSQRNASGSHLPWPQMQTSCMSLSSMRLDHSSQPNFPPHATTPPHDWPPPPHEHPLPPVEKHHHPLPHQSSPSTSRPNDARCSSESGRFPQTLSPWQSCGGRAPSPTTPPFSRPGDHPRAPTRADHLSSLPMTPLPLRPALLEDPAPPTTRSLFASRYLPPLPNPVRPGPGSFPPPSALRVLPITKDFSPTPLVRSGPHSSSSEYTLPPLLNEQHHT